MINSSLQPKINPMFRLQWEQVQECYVLLYPEGMVKLNGSAGEIMQLIDGNNKVVDIINTLNDKFPDAGDLTEDIYEFLSAAGEKKWLYYEQ
ncbi:pyrroloquinoline quinone biosynthesis peptide chaperone PqqD [Glaciecola sp. 33A]|jgi:pyrroloquinoline quinone biosynthesis protein D|uniref:pyrroloquinoline quinone biosynthesis peptide chaperone PqqD n=1 Tax=Glaciecola sp. 33A TaxID=2057807 RepID=UPI000C31EC1C|nr:pyrroloquinoline quinone biosynthesis peptide chaperone PqqD [Glaciecola sp. 33A]PKI01231.1 pyrroloquinoline quinone biosynthesis peptide chaperone PqqD [Glaciecola sp. 33A]